MRLLRYLLPALLLYSAQVSAECLTRGTGNMGIVIERAAGSVLVVDRSSHSTLFRVQGLGDLSHASAVFSPDERYAYIFGRDGGLTRLDILCGKITHRVVQGGNSIGGAISQDAVSSPYPIMSPAG